MHKRPSKGIRDYNETSDILFFIYKHTVFDEIVPHMATSLLVKQQFQEFGPVAVILPWP